MATWKRCEKSPFYRRASYTKRFDKILEALDGAYVDPIDLVAIHTIPGDDSVLALKWRITRWDGAASFETAHPLEVEALSAWTRRVAAEMDGGISKKAREALLADLDVDLALRELLLGAVERFVFMAPDEISSFSQIEVPRNREALEGLLFHWGVGPC